jgi:hypothetical protein
MKVARDQGAELIVMGHTGSGYVTRALLGSTAENVVRRRAVPRVGGSVAPAQQCSYGACGPERAPGERTGRGRSALGVGESGLKVRIADLHALGPRARVRAA